MRESLENVPAAGLTQKGFMVVPPDLPVDRLIDDYFLHSAQRGIPVVAGDRLAGMVSLEDVRKLERRSWPYKTVRDFMTPAGDLLQVAPQDDVYRVLSLLGEREVNQVPVVDDGHVRGLIRREDILKWLSLYEQPGRPEAAVAGR